MAEAVRVEGLKDLRKALRATDKGALKEVQAVTKAAAELVAAEARVFVPRKSGRLAASIKAATSGNSGIVKSNLPYAAVHEYGGMIRPKGAPIKINRSLFVGRAQTAKEKQVLELLSQRFNDLAQRNGW